MMFDKGFIVCFAALLLLKGFDCKLLEGNKHNEITKLKTIANNNRPQLKTNASSNSSNVLRPKLLLKKIVVQQPELPKLSPIKSPQVEVEQSLFTPAAGLNEMLVPKNSTTALICEPIFNENSVEKTAFWYKDGKIIANVTGHSNAVYDNRTIEFEGPIPKVGFLIITKIQLEDLLIEDEGDYWCAREDNGLQGERSRLRVAFLHVLPSTQSLRIHFGAEEKERSGDFVNGVFIGRPYLGETIFIDCPETKALPKPTVSWLFEGEPVDFSENRLEVQKNGSLIIHRFLPSDSGTYECVLVNFAGRSSAKIFIGLPLPSEKYTDVMSSQVKAGGKTSNFVLPISCVDYFRNEILWFLIGCLTTSCIVLIYLIFGIIFYKCSKRGRRQRFAFLPYINSRDQLNDANSTVNRNRGGGGNPPSLWRSLLRIDPSLIPGFRKVIAPAPLSMQRVGAEQRNMVDGSNDQLLLNSNTQNNEIYKSTIATNLNLQLDSNYLIRN